MTAGYSQTPLVRKLGIKTGQRLAVLNAPDDYPKTLGQLPDAVEVVADVDREMDFIQFFTLNTPELEAVFPRLKHALAQDGMLWVSWPKQSSKVETDLSENGQGDWPGQPPGGRQDLRGRRDLVGAKVRSQAEGPGLISRCTSSYMRTRRNGRFSDPDAA